MTAVPTRDDDDPDRDIKPLSPEERRKLFDLPEPPRAAPAPPSAAPRDGRDHFLELDTSAIPGERPGNVISTIRVGGIVVDVVKLSFVGAAVGVILLAAIRFVYRWHD